MKTVWKHIITILSIVLMLAIAEKESSAQKIDAFARVSVSPREGVVRQPYKVTISVYSGTWFAKPLQFANLRIDNAFIIPFTRTVSSVNYINKKKYATLSFYYLVFPYNTGNLQVPALDIHTSIPVDGDYKGTPYTIRTKAQNIKVKPIPSAKNEEVWMVAKNITFKDSWSKSLEGLKVGDVVEREIAMSASGTLPTLIQPLEIEKPELVSTYPKQPILKDNRTNNDVNGARTEKYSYLFEAEGEVTLPEQELLWWNPDTKRVYKRTIPEQKLTIIANPDLALMESLKDSLLAISAPVNVLAEGKKTPWIKIVILFVLAFLSLYFGWKAIAIFLHNSKEKRAVYLQSEAYLYKCAILALNRKSKNEFINALYLWFDLWRLPNSEPMLAVYLTKDENRLFYSIFKEDVELTSDKRKRLKYMVSNLRASKYSEKKDKKQALNLT